MFIKIGLFFLWLLLTPTLLFSSALTLHRLKKVNNLSNQTVSQLPSSLPPIQALDGQVLGVQINDLRPYLVANFLQNTKLEPYSQSIVETSDRYDLDYRLIPAIAMKETGGGDKAREGSYNAWGFENGRTNFSSWEEAINAVAKTLKEKYVARGLTTPEQIMLVYAPPQGTTGKWAQDINFFFTKLESF